MIDYIIIAVIAVIVGLAVWYIVREKKRGKKCIGCPYANSCKSCSCASQKEKQGKG